MDLHQASRTAALAFSIWTAWKVWAPPHALVSKDEQPAQEGSVKNAPAHSGWEVGLTPFMWRMLFGFSITCQTVFQIYVFQHYAGGLRTFSKVEWSTIDILALLCMAYAAKLRTDAYRTLGKYFTYK